MAKRESISVSFTPEQAEFLASCVATGRYQSTSEVVREAIRLLEDTHARRTAHIAHLQHLIELGAQQLAAGEELDLDVVLGGLADKHKRLSGSEGVD